MECHLPETVCTQLFCKVNGWTLLSESFKFCEKPLRVPLFDLSSATTCVKDGVYEPPFFVCP